MVGLLTRIEMDPKAKVAATLKRFWVCVSEKTNHFHTDLIINWSAQPQGRLRIVLQSSDNELFC